MLAFTAGITDECCKTIKMDSIVRSFRTFLIIFVATGAADNFLSFVVIPCLTVEHSFTMTTCS